jgi:nucleotide-binding universal stress UspA family protein
MANKKSAGKILVPVDGSEQSLQAAETAALIAKKTRATVTVLHVMPMGRPLSGINAKVNIPATATSAYAGFYAELRSTYEIPSSVVGELMARLEQEGDKIIADAEAVFKEENVKVESETIRGKNPAEAILDKSEEGFDLTVIGGHGDNEKDPYALGSVTKNVMRHTKCPTLIAKETTPLSSLLVCLDGSKHSLEALDYVAGLAEKIGSKMTLLNVQEPDLHEVAPQVCSGLADAIVSKALDSIKNRKFVAEKKVECGVASDTIVDVADRDKHDLIVMGDKGLSSVRRFMFGSVSDDVACKAKCSVMIVP